MIDERNKTMSAKKLADGCINGLIDLKNSRQRGLVWKRNQQSLLINSLIEGYPIPAIYLVEDDENGLFVIDGKQRSNAISGFINGEYPLDKTTPPVELRSGESYCLSGKTFNELPEEIQDNIKEAELRISYIKDATDDQLDEIFFRLNNGSAMSNIIKTCSRARSIEQINLAADHAIFQTALNAANLQKYEHKNLVIKSWIILNADDSPSFAGQYVQNIMETTDISDDSILILWNCFNRMLDVYTYIDQNLENDEIKKTILNNLAKPTHFASLMPIIKRSLDEEIETTSFSTWIIEFFPGTKIASIDERYNEAARSNKKENIRIRHEILTFSYEKAFPPADEAASA